MTAAAASSTQINLTWTDNASSEEGFKIERCQGSGCTTFAQIATVAASMTTYSNTALTGGTSYSYRIRAYNTAGDSPYSNTATASTTAVAPTAPTNLAASASSSSQINLTWTDNAGNEAGFKIERSLTANGNKYVQVATVGPDAVSYSDTQLSASTTYYYRVAAYNAAGTSTYSNKASATTSAATAPSNLTATAASSTQINAEPPAVSAYLKVATSAQSDVMRDPR